MTDDQQSRLRLSPHSPWRAYLELLRVPNLFTAAADVAMGFLFVRRVWAPGDGWLLGLLVLASCLLYASGVVLNDLFDFAVDTHQRPERPLPSGRVSLRAARRLGWGLLLSGVVPAWLCAVTVGHLRPAMVAGLLAACILLYDAYLKQTPLGPVLMGGCRMLNVLLGMSVATAAWQTPHWLVAGGIGTYVVGVTWFARTEAARSSRLHLAAATAVMILGIALVASFPGWINDFAVPTKEQPGHWGTLMVILAAVVGWRCLRAVIEPSPARVQSVVRLCILWLVVLDAAVCCAAGGPVCAIVILLLLPPAALLGRWIRLT
jgi:4-hydroxybenzoate polyprenyltransferase